MNARISSIWHSTASKEYAMWFKGWKYLIANGYTDKGSIANLCEEANITEDLHWTWAANLEIDRAESRYCF